MRTTFRGYAIAVACLALPAVVGAQPRGATTIDCDLQFLLATAPDTLSERWRPLYPATRTAAWLPLMADGRWLELIDSVRMSFDVEVARHFTESRASDPRVGRLRIRLDSLRQRMARLADAGSVDALRTNAADLADLRRVGPSVFRPSLRDGEAFLFRGSAEEIRLMNDDPADVRRTICYHSAMASVVTDRFTADARRYAAEILAQKEVRWTSYLDRGYSQLPWELYINLRAARNAGILDPPTRQLILLHPSVSVQVAGGSWRRIESHEAIAVEPLGFIWYRSEYRSYFGLSSVVVFASNTGTSVGPFLHLGRVAKIGYTFPLREKGENSSTRSGGLLISLDLYKYLSDRTAQVEQVMSGLKMKALGGAATAPR